jgi:hypothetical protein
MHPPPRFWPFGLKYTEPFANRISTPPFTGTTALMATDPV